MSFPTQPTLFRCKGCNLVQRSSSRICACCGGSGDKLIDHDWRCGLSNRPKKKSKYLSNTLTSDLNPKQEWVRCTLCNGVQHTRGTRCMFCHKPEFYFVHYLDQVIAANEFLHQQARRKATRRLWTTASLYSFDPLIIPGVARAEILEDQVMPMDGTCKFCKVCKLVQRCDMDECRFCGRSKLLNFDWRNKKVNECFSYSYDSESTEEASAVYSYESWQQCRCCNLVQHSKSNICMFCKPTSQDYRMQRYLPDQRKLALSVFTRQQKERRHSNQPWIDASIYPFDMDVHPSPGVTPSKIYSWGFGLFGKSPVPAYIHEQKSDKSCWDCMLVQKTLFSFCRGCGGKNVVTGSFEKRAFEDTWRACLNCCKLQWGGVSCCVNCSSDELLVWRPSQPNFEPNQINVRSRARNESPTSVIRPPPIAASLPDLIDDLSTIQYENTTNMTTGVTPPPTPASLPQVLDPPKQPINSKRCISHQISSKSISMETTLESIDKLLEMLTTSDQKMPPAQAPPSISVTYWSCQQCTYHNQCSSISCQVCQSPRGQSPAVQQEEKYNSDDDRKMPAVATNEQKINAGRFQFEEDEFYNAESEDLIASPRAKDLLESIILDLQCPICFEIFQDPVTLPCGHSLCSQHVDEIDYKCVTCREPFSQDSCCSDTILQKNIHTVLLLTKQIGGEQFHDTTIRDAIEHMEQSPNNTISV